MQTPRPYVFLKDACKIARCCCTESEARNVSQVFDCDFIPLAEQDAARSRFVRVFRAFLAHEDDRDIFDLLADVDEARADAMLVGIPLDELMLTQSQELAARQQTGGSR